MHAEACPAASNLNLNMRLGALSSMPPFTFQGDEAITSECRLADEEQVPTHEPRRCKRCREQLPATFFQVNPKRLGGRMGECSACIAEQSRADSTREVTIPEEKQCGSCQETLPAAQFDRNCGSPDGLLWSCKQCLRDRRRVPLVTAHVAFKKCGSCGLALPAAAFGKDSR